MNSFPVFIEILYPMPPPKANMKGAIILFCCLFFILAGKSNAGTIFVDICADSPGDGSRSNPYHNLTAALNAAAPGDVIVVQSGFHPERLIIDKPLTITATGGPVVIGQAASYVDIRANCPGDGSTKNPYYNLSAAVDAAAPGEVIILRNRYYPESLTINKPLTIITCGKQTIIGQDQALFVMSLNIRIQGDPNPNNWENRFPRIVKMLWTYEAGQGPHIIGMQELELEPLFNLNDRLSNYRFFGKDRGDGEAVAIFYRPNRLELIEHGDFFLGISERRSRGNCDGRDKDHNNRVVVWGRFRDKQSQKTFYVYNTHFSHKNSCERRGSALIMADNIAKRAHLNDPVIAMGDFNDGQEPDGRLNTSFEMLLDNTGLVNSYRVIHKFHENEEFSTSNTGFKNVRKGRMIDFVLVSPSFQVYNANIDRTMFTSSGGPVCCYRINSQGNCTSTGDKSSGLLMYSDHWALWAVVGLGHKH
jgi:endonuclease/exonuclease/phosphatase family metal-dependent hydrolase